MSTLGIIALCALVWVAVIFVGVALCAAAARGDRR
jgi:hypothetical protein